MEGDLKIGREEVVIGLGGFLRKDIGGNGLPLSYSAFDALIATPEIQAL